MALDLGWDYSYTYNLAHKDSLVTIQLGTVIKIAEYLGVKHLKSFRNLSWDKRRE